MKSSVNPSTVGQSVTFTATVTSPTTIPTGTVTFMDSSTVLGTGTLSSGKSNLRHSQFECWVAQHHRDLRWNFEHQGKHVAGADAGRELIVSMRTAQLLAGDDAIWGGDKTLNRLPRLRHRRGAAPGALRLRAPVCVRDAERL